MFDIYGKYTYARIFAETCDADALSQLYDLCNHPIYEGAIIRVMPDVHKGAGCTVGTTIHMSRRAVIPDIVGADIGCGVLTTLFSFDGEIDFNSLDGFIAESIPSGASVRERVHKGLSPDVKRDILSVVEELGMYKAESAFLRSVGSLGGGNHYIEIGRLSDGRYALSVHSGSRGFGKCIAEYFSDRADEYVAENRLTGFKHSMPYLEGAGYDLYITEMLRAQNMAAENRRLISHDILDALGASATDSFDTVHNYVETHRDGSITVRKGAISAKEGQRVAIPMNMRDGVLICVGLGNADWNFSAPHGAGRSMSRSEAKACLDPEEYRREMSGIATWSVLPETIDESPMAYKPYELVASQIVETVSITERVRPLYNFKARTLH